MRGSTEEATKIEDFYNKLQLKNGSKAQYDLFSLTETITEIRYKT